MLTLHTILYMIPPRQPYTFDRAVRMAITALTIAALLLLVRYLSSVLLPFIIALFLVYLINPLVKSIQRVLHLRKRMFAVIITLLLIFGVIGGIVYWMAPVFAREMVRMANLIRIYVEDIDYKAMLPPSIDTQLRDFLRDYNVMDYFNPENFGPILQKISSKMWTFISGSFHVMSMLLGMMIVLLYVVFLLLDFDRFESQWPGFVPEKYRSLAMEVVGDMKDGMNTYFRLQGLIALIVGVLFSIGFTIIGLPIPFVIGMFIGLLNLIPYLQLLGIIPALLLALLKALEAGTGFWHEAFLVLLVISVVQLIQDLVLVPRIMGKAYNLNPAILLLALSVWGSLLGIIGLFLALPLTTVLISFYKKFVLHVGKDDRPLIVDSHEQPVTSMRLPPES
ncbi:putative PurR-regulated permease PerM [Breznakibacter xylanolyticus]|uniref:Putative PurR-regulated permease PerM n=2 Tax=Breznakibacter xylanolyticus TaxID=990 RepID=A0A2W7MYU0_9BACT|nr:putative PurR-regulated permease PerM [Breznakibacter xylanolyticus]